MTEIGEKGGRREKEGVAEVRVGAWEVGSWFAVSCVGLYKGIV